MTPRWPLVAALALAMMILGLVVLLRIGVPISDEPDANAVPVNRYGLTPERALEIADWERRAFRILEELYQIGDNWVEHEVVRGTEAASMLADDDIRVDIWAKDPEDERLEAIVDKLVGLRAGSEPVPIVVHDVPRNRAELQDLERAAMERRPGEDVDITWDVERGTLVIAPGSGPPPVEGWEPAEQVAGVWWLWQLDGRRIVVKAEVGGDASCSRFSRLEATESATTVEILSINDISKHAADGGGCFMARGSEYAEVMLDAPLGNRRLTGCRLGLYPIDERVDCRQIVP